MNKQEFLDSLRRSLNSTHDSSLIESNISYYNSYIDEELSKGRSLEDILLELGEPSLLARSIRDAAGISSNFEQDKEYYSEKKAYENTRQTYTDDYGNEINNENKNSKSKIFKLNSFSFNLILIGILAVILLIFVGIFILFAGLAKLFAPVLIPLIVAYLIYRLYMMYKS